MKNGLATYFIGLIFALGLGLSGMTKPEKVLGFLDAFGPWDPSLLFVMLSALLIYAVLFQIIRRKRKPLFSDQFHLPKRTAIDRPLLVGSVLFGSGWGLAGYCPAPAITAIASFQLSPILFVLSLLLGMWIFQRFDRSASRR